MTDLAQAQARILELEAEVDRQREDRDRLACIMEKADALHDVAIQAVPTVGKATDCPALKSDAFVKMFAPCIRDDLEQAAKSYREARHAR